MRFYFKNFLILLLIITIGSIFFWFIFTSSIGNHYYSNYNNNKNHSISKNTFENLITTTNSIINIEKSINEHLINLKQNNNDDVNYVSEKKISNHPKRIRNISCNINDEYKINCLKLINGKNTTVYIPFPFIQKYFEINGKLINKNNNEDEYFEWNHSYSKIFYPDEPYNHLGKFLWFGNYNVEFRERVKCISAIEHVPISTQWFQDGHLYPTQICQYGLSHFNKNLTSSTVTTKSNPIKLIENGVVNTKLLESNSIFTAKKNFVILKDASIYLRNQHFNNLISQFEMKIIPNNNKNVSIILSIVNTLNEQVLKIIYSTVDKTIDLNQLKNNTVIYGIGSNAWQNGWFKLTRDLLVDLLKGSLIFDRKKNNNYLYLSQIQIHGIVHLKNFQLKTSASEEFALAAGDWLVKNQNFSDGGWKIQVKRKLAKGLLVINEGWHSAMAQGHAISLLTRLYHSTKNLKYLNSAKKALKLFEIESFKNGVKAMLFDRLSWYEEYPTVPSIFVLNGFIYSLFGLYDLTKTCQTNNLNNIDYNNDEFCKKAQQLYEDGLHSLETVLPLFDSGSGSFYDLRHLNLGIAPNLARWDYHSTHINQLLYLNTLTRNDLFKTTAERWISYMKGHRASHN